MFEVIFISNKFVKQLKIEFNKKTLFSFLIYLITKRLVQQPVFKYSGIATHVCMAI